MASTLNSTCNGLTVMKYLSCTNTKEIGSTNFNSINAKFLKSSKRMYILTPFHFTRKIGTIVKATSEPPKTENKSSSEEKPSSPFTPGKFASSTEPSPFAPGKFANISKVETEKKIGNITDVKPPTPSTDTQTPATTPPPASTPIPKSPIPNTPVSPFQVKPTAASNSSLASVSLPASGSVRPSPSFGSSNKRVIKALQADQKSVLKSSPPKNLFDDPRRTPEEIEAEKWRFSIDRNQFLLIMSFFASSLLMFATVYFVWKVGAIHFNDDI